MIITEAVINYWSAHEKLIDFMNQ